MKDGNPPMDMNVMKPDINAPHDPLAKIALKLVPTSKKIVPTQKDKAI